MGRLHQLVKNGGKIMLFMRFASRWDQHLCSTPGRPGPRILPFYAVEIMLSRQSMREYIKVAVPNVLLTYCNIYFILYAVAYCSDTRLEYIFSLGECFTHTHAFISFIQINAPNWICDFYEWISILASRDERGAWNRCAPPRRLYPTKFIHTFLVSQIIICISRFTITSSYHYHLCHIFQIFLTNIVYYPQSPLSTHSPILAVPNMADTTYSLAVLAGTLRCSYGWAARALRARCSAHHIKYFFGSCQWRR